MKALKYISADGQKTVIDIGDKDLVLCTAISTAIEQYKQDFRGLCYVHYKENVENAQNAIKSTKHIIRELQTIYDVISNPVKTCDQPGARMTVATWF